MASDKLYYQWIKGENAPNIETFTKEIKLGEEQFLLFESGLQVNKKLVGDFVMEIASPTTPFINPLDFMAAQNIKESTVPYEQYTNDSQNSYQQNLNNVKNNLGNAEIIPHPDDLVAVAEFNRNHRQDQNKPVLDKSGMHEIVPVNKEIVNHHIEIVKEPIIETNPIKHLIEKSKKTKTDISVNLSIDLPSKDFLNIIKESFEDSEEDIIKYILALFKTPNFDEELKIFVRQYLEIEKPESIVQKNETTLNKQVSKKLPIKKKS